VDRVVDLLRVGEETAAPQIYMKQGQSLARAINDLFDPNVTWDRYRAARKRGPPP
jgi:hypothetical protein